MAGVLGEIGIRRGQEGERWAWLPTRAGRPLPSSPLLEPEGDGRAEDALSDDSPSDDSPSEEPPTLAAWRVPVLLLSGQDTAAFLSAATGRQMLAPGVLLGDSVAFWAQAYRFAAALVAREQFLPGLADTAAGWRAQWEPVFIGDDAERLAGLARAMPHACRALSESPQRAPESAPADLLRRRLGSFTDDLVRTAIAERKPAAAPRFDSVHDRWLHALRSPDGQMEGDASDLAESIRLWRRRLVATTEAPFRLTFRLEEPPSPLFDEAAAVPTQAAPAQAGTWTVRTLLQAADDPSLLIDVAEAWEPSAQTAALFAARGFEARGHLLAALGQAMDLFPALAERLKEQAPDSTAFPSAVALPTEAAYRFLTETAWLLQQAGFGVRLPAWWARRGAQRLATGATVRSPPMQAAAGLSLASLVDVDWHAMLGDERLTREELEALAALKAPLVELRGQWVEVDAGAIRAALDFWDKHEALPAREAIRLALGLGEGGLGEGDLPVAHVEGTGWMGELLRRLTDGDQIEPLPTPDGFDGTLRPYQERGAAWMAFLQQWGLGACLADDMGLGKTVQTLALVQHNRESGARKPVLLVCPTSVLGNWQREAERFTPRLPVLVHHGTRRPKDAAAFKKQA